MHKGLWLSPEAVKEVRTATDLALHGTEQMAHTIGRSMATMVATKRHLWLNLLGIKEKDKLSL